ncbi:MAG TPA: hypothetical protein DIW81_19510 [Planctomycetaceae bacterium]|nr:hypothetical protein [Planctomycetaceae bacterium]
MKQNLVDQIIFTTKAQRHEEFCNKIASNPSGCFLLIFKIPESLCVFLPSWFQNYYLKKLLVSTGVLAVNFSHCW